jgi:DNA polymerase elongation subunit (family B)
MQNLQNLFRENEWNLIQDILTNGKTESWYELSTRYNIKPQGSSIQRRKAANDIYRKYLRKINSTIEESIQPKVLIYDIETSKTIFELWWSGKQFVNGNSSLEDSKIVTISYKWLGSDEVGAVKWSKKKSDKKLIKKFLKVYNQADMVIGINNDRFDNKYINTRAAKYGLDVNLHVKSLDVQRECRRLFRLPSYSMKYLGRYFQLPQQKMKVHLEDIWEDIAHGTPKQAKKAMNLLIEYNVVDILTTEQLYLKLKKYLKHPIHLGVLKGEGKITCPACGSNNVKAKKTTWTSAGTVQIIMECKEDGHTYKVSNSTYLKEFTNG